MPRPPVIPEKYVAIAVFRFISANPGKLTTQVQEGLLDQLKQYQIQEAMHWLEKQRFVEKRKALGNSGRTWWALMSVSKFLDSFNYASSTPRNGAAHSHANRAADP